MNPDGTVRLLTRAFHSACEPDVSYNARRFLFAGKPTAGAPWDIYEMTLDGESVRQVTRDLGNCRQPSYQSSHYQISESNDTWPQVTFVRFDDRATGEGGATPVSQLWTCKPDGTLSRPITFNLANDAEPTMLGDGRILFASGRREAGRRSRRRVLRCWTLIPTARTALPLWFKPANA